MPCRYCKHYKIAKNVKRDDLHPLEVNQCKIKSKPGKPVFTKASFSCDDYLVSE